MAEKFVVVGFGWVGQANALALRLLGNDVSYVDPGKPEHHYTKHRATYEAIGRLSSVLENDSEDTWYVVCVGDRVSQDGVQDISNIEAALKSLSGARGGVILRSTVLPEHLEKLQFDYYVPEFLHEKFAVEECVTPYLFVVGKRGDVRAEPAVFDTWRESARKSFSGTPREASLIKYLSNLWNAMRIAFVNEFGDAIGRPTDKEHLQEIERIVNFLFDNRSYQRYGRAFGGHCLPKDSRAFLASFKKSGHTDLPLIAGMYESNDRHLALEKELPLMPEWYSEWPDRHISTREALRALVHSLAKYIRHPGALLNKFTRRV